jgi:hypothetical protein
MSMRHLLLCLVAVGLVGAGCGADEPVLPKKPVVNVPVCPDPLATGCDDEDKVVSVAIAPSEVTLLSGTTQQFTATVTVTGQAVTDVTWSVKQENGGVINEAGLYTAPLVAGVYTVVATSTADALKKAEATVTVQLPGGGEQGVISVAVNPVAVTLQRNAQQQFTATVANSSNQNVIWSVTGSGSIDASGLYTAPGQNTNDIVTATSVADSTKTASATVTVTNQAPPAEVVVTISPKTAATWVNGKVDFNVSVEGANNQVTYSVDGGAVNGTINNGGTYTAPGVAGVFTVRAVSNHDANAFDTATVTVSVPNFSVDIDPGFASIETGATYTFVATVNGPTQGQPVNWTVDTENGGSIGGNGKYTAPLVPGTYTIRATSKTDPAQSATATVQVNLADPIVSITPASAHTEINSSTQFTVSVTNTRWNNFTVELAEPTALGSLNVQPTDVFMGSANVNFTALGTPGSVQVVVKTINQTPYRTARANLTIHAPMPIVTITPMAPSMETETTQQFAVSVTNTQYNSFTLTAQPANSFLSATAGSGANNLVTYTAPITAGTYTVIATAVSDSTKTATATIQVYEADPILTLLSPAAVTVTAGTQYQFSASVTNVANIHTGILWTVVGGAANGTLSASGLYTPPAADGVYTVRATSTAKPSVFVTATIQVYTALCPAGAKDIVFSNQGANGDWDYGLGDDETISYTRYYYTSGKHAAPIGYDEIGGQWNAYPANDVTMAVEYTDPGPDGLWRTADDVITGIWKLKYDANNRLEMYAQMVSGPDNVLGSPDDVTGPGAIYTWFFNDLHEWSPSRVKRFAAMAGATLEDSEIVQVEKWTTEVAWYCQNWVCGHYWVFTGRIHNNPGFDGLWDTGDDVESYYIRQIPLNTWGNLATWWTRSEYRGNFRYESYYWYTGGMPNAFLTGGQTIRGHNTTGRYSNHAYLPEYHNDGGANYTSSWERDKNGNWISQSRLRACPY